MTATPAQVANDLDAQGRFHLRRDRDVAQACLDAARMIRRLLAGEPIDGRSWHGLIRRLMDREYQFRATPETQIAKSISRGLTTLRSLRNGAGA